MKKKVDSMQYNYKRISKHFWDYALFPKTADVEQIIQRGGKDNDYYEGIFLYKDDQYKQFIAALDDANKYLNKNLNVNSLQAVPSTLLSDLRRKAKNGDKVAEDIQKRLSVKGVTDVITNKLVLDFDSDNFEEAKTDTMKAIERLKQNGITENSIQLCFSGNKGFSIEVHSEEYFSPEDFLGMVNTISQGLKTFDTTVKDPQRLFRIPLTKHNTSGLYKVPLKVSSLKGLDRKQVEQYSKNITHEHLEIKNKWVKAKALNIATKKEEHKKETPVLETTEIDLSQRPMWLSPARYMLQEGFFKKGERNEAFMILASTYKNQGFDREMAYAMLEVVANKQAARNNEVIKNIDDIDREVLSTVYSYGWKGGTYSDKTNGLLLKLIEQYNLKDNKDTSSSFVPRNIGDIGGKFKTYVKNLEHNTIKTGIKSLDEKIFLSTGANVGIVGAPGSGKTSLALNILNNTSKAGIKTVFASFDMASTRMYEKLCFKVSGLTRDELYQTFKEDREEEILNKIKEEFGNVFFFDKSAASVEDIRQYISKCEEECGEKVKLVMIDYFERVHSDVNDDFSASKKVASEIQDMVNDLDICSITLVQPNKISGDMSQPITSYSNIKGSAFLAQSFRMILSIYREGFNPLNSATDKFLTINCLKNDLGEPCSIDFSWNGRRGEIGELDKSGKQALDFLREEKLNEETKEDDYV